MYFLFSHPNVILNPIELLAKVLRLKLKFQFYFLAKIVYS